MPDLVSGIHDFNQALASKKVVDGRDELGHDGGKLRSKSAKQRDNKA